MLINTAIRNYVAAHNARLARKNLAPLPIDFWLRQREKLRRFSKNTDVLRPSARVIGSKGQHLPIPELAELFSGVHIGTWTLDKDSIALLWKKLQEEQPDIILECGSGVSTLLFSRFFSLHHPQGRVISFEQGADEKQRIEQWLDKTQLRAFATLFHTPLDPNGRYAFDLQALDKALGGKKADWLIVDGPAGPQSCRDNTLPTLLPYMKKESRWWMDDAFRDGELAYLQQWDQNEHIQVAGIFPIGKGLGMGKLH